MLINIENSPKKNPEAIRDFFLFILKEY